MVAKSMLNQRLDNKLVFSDNLLTLHERQNNVGHIIFIFYHKIYIETTFS